MSGTSAPIGLSLPLGEDDVLRLRAGDMVELSGTLIVARDAAHQRMFGALDRGEPLPFDPEGAVIYYMGPSPPRPGNVIGAAGPTTSRRMDPYVPRLLELGVRAFIGKGQRADAVREALEKHRGIDFSGLGGHGAWLARQIESSEVVAYDDLGPEAIRRLVVRDFPAVVAYDAHGGDVFTQGRQRWSTSPA